MKPLTLVSGLARLGSVAASRSANPILGSVLMEHDDGGSLRMTTTDAETWLSVSFPSSSYDLPRCAVDFKTFRAAIKGCRTLPNLSLEDGRLTVGARTLATLDVRDFPVAPKVGPLLKSWGPVAAEIGTVAIAASQDVCRAGLCGVYLDPKGGIVATDGHRLHSTVIARDGKLPADWYAGRLDVIVPRDPCVLLGKLKGAERGRFDFDASALSFAGPNWSMTARVPMGDATFPDWRQVVPSSCERSVVCRAADLADAATRAISVYGRAGRAPIVKLDCNGSIAWSARFEDVSEAGDVPARKDGPDILIGLNPRYLLDALRAVAGSNPAGAVQLRIGDALSPVVLRGIERHRAAVVMPMRIE